jgi:hypothetical protein
MRAPFANNFHIEDFQIDDSIILKQYLILESIPIIETVQFIVGNAFDIIYGDFSVEQVTDTNLLLYPDAQIGDYVVSWLTDSGTSSSSSSSDSKIISDILESGLYDTIQIRYISES